MNYNKKNINHLISKWFSFRENDLAIMNEDDKKHLIKFDEHMQNILEKVPENSKELIKKELENLDEEFTDYVLHWNKKYYKHGFKDAFSLFLFGTDDKIDF